MTHHAIGKDCLSAKMDWLFVPGLAGETMKNSEQAKKERLALRLLSFW